MTAEEARRRLALAAKGENRKLRDLARDISVDSGKPVETLTYLWISSDAKNRRKVETVLEGLGAVGVPSLLTLKNPALAARAALQAARALLAGQQRIAARLAQLLESRVPMPSSPSAGRTEEKELRSRECDEAYLLARQLLKGDDSERERFQMRRAFLLMTEAERDSEIDKYKSSGWWSALVEAE